MKNLGLVWSVKFDNYIVSHIYLQNGISSIEILTRRSFVPHFYLFFTLKKKRDNTYDYPFFLQICVMCIFPKNKMHNCM